MPRQLGHQPAEAESPRRRVNASTVSSIASPLATAGAVRRWPAAQVESNVPGEDQRLVTPCREQHRLARIEADQQREAPSGGGTVRSTGAGLAASPRPPCGDPAPPSSTTTGVPAQRERIRYRDPACRNARVAAADRPAFPWSRAAPGHGRPVRRRTAAQVQVGEAARRPQHVRRWQRPGRRQTGGGVGTRCADACACERPPHVSARARRRATPLCTGASRYSSTERSPRRISAATCMPAAERQRDAVERHALCRQRDAREKRPCAGDGSAPVMSRRAGQRLRWHRDRRGRRCRR